MGLFHVLACKYHAVHVVSLGYLDQLLFAHEARDIIKQPFRPGDAGFFGELSRLLTRHLVDAKSNEKEVKETDSQIPSTHVAQSSPHPEKQKPGEPSLPYTLNWPNHAALYIWE